VARTLSGDRVGQLEKPMTAPPFYLLLDEMLELPPATIKGSEKLPELERWDSLACICFIALLDKNFELQIPAIKLLECQTVADLVALAGNNIR
jgi:acyl carrier protein